VLDVLKEMTGGRGPDACIDAVGMEAHGTGPQHAYDRVKQALHLETDRGQALREAIMACRKGGTLSVLGVYGLIDKFPMGAIMNKAMTVRTAQQHGQAYMERLLTHAQKGELNPAYLATHRFSLEDAPRGYDMFKHKKDGCVPRCSRRNDRPGLTVTRGVPESSYRGTSREQRSVFPARGGNARIPSLDEMQYHLTATPPVAICSCRQRPAPAIQSSSRRRHESRQLDLAELPQQGARRLRHRHLERAIDRLFLGAARVIDIRPDGEDHRLLERLVDIQHRDAVRVHRQHPAAVAARRRAHITRIAQTTHHAADQDRVGVQHDGQLFRTRRALASVYMNQGVQHARQPEISSHRYPPDASIPQLRKYRNSQPQSLLQKFLFNRVRRRAPNPAASIAAPLLGGYGG